MGPRIDLDPDWLREKYVEEWMTANEMAELVDASPKTIRRRMRENGIEIRSGGNTKKPLSKEKLELEYVENGLSAREIANGEEYSRNHVQRSLEYHDMDIRSRKKAIWAKHGDECAYRTHPRGHVMVSSGKDSAYVHQLVAIAEGVDPYKIFSDGEFQCHHKNHIPWDNRPENIETMRESEHHSTHISDMVWDDSGAFVKKDLR